MKLTVQAKSVTEVGSIEELDLLLDQLHDACDPARPMIVSIEYPYECRVDIGLGSPESIVMVWPQFHNAPPGECYMSISGKEVSGTKWFYLQGDGDTELDRKYMIPVNIARQVVRDFILTGKRSEKIKWQKDEY